MTNEPRESSNRQWIIPRDYVFVGSDVNRLRLVAYLTLSSLCSTNTANEGNINHHLVGNLFQYNFLIMHTYIYNVLTFVYVIINRVIISETDAMLKKGFQNLHIILFYVALNDDSIIRI